MEQVKEAFTKVKQDIDSLRKEVSILNNELIETRQGLIEVCDILRNLSKKYEENKKKEGEKKIPAQKSQDSADISSTSTNSSYNIPQNPQKAQNYNISIGNEGVPTDRQTNQQTDQHINKGSYNKEPSLQSNTINDAAQILESLDNLKKEIRLKFKRLTDQEFLVFSMIYQSSEEKGYTDYKNLSEKLKLTESSIRDYIGRLIKKGIPLDKIKINNKTIHISVSQNLKKIASLPTILQLRAI